MRKMFAVAALALVSLNASAAFAATPAPAATAPAPKYTTADTEIGTLLDDPAAKAIIEKHIPGFVGNDQIDMARAMTLRAIQPFAEAEVTDERLAAIDAELAKLPAK
jgi:para-nitrobenzyl esterase